jgi:oxygen-independent coproporphyrinogen-3 oxidase
MRNASVYVHFPWCLAKCPYCDFVSYALPGRTAEQRQTDRSAIDHAGYADAVLRELEARASLLGEDRIVGSVFFGGGTPSLWDARELGRVLDGVRSRLRCAPQLEVTVECNPTSLDADKARALGDVGVNRLSIGTQSLRADQLRFLGRLHDPVGALAAIDGAVASGVRVSTDVIFGLPEQSPEDARAQVEALADRGLMHLSCYQLTIEPGTQFGELAKRGRLPLADDGMVAEAFLAIDEALASRGFAHYEISNYARPGHEARHNLAYWRGDEYLGLGCAAYGFVRTDASDGVARGVRYRNAIVAERYVAATRSALPGRAEEGDGVTMTSERLDGETMLRERIMLGLRLSRGLDVKATARELGVAPWPPARAKAAALLEARGRLARESERTFIPRDAWLFTDDTAARLF